MKEYIEKIGYGSQDISSGIDIFWLPRPDTTSIKISADEQVALLNKLLTVNFRSLKRISRYYAILCRQRRPVKERFTVRPDPHGAGW